MRDSINQKMREIRDIDKRALSRAQNLLDNLTKPKESLGRLEEFDRRYCAITGEEKPRIHQ